jgi:hypothetical protein
MARSLPSPISLSSPKILLWPGKLRAGKVSARIRAGRVAANIMATGPRHSHRTTACPNPTASMTASTSAARSWHVACLGHGGGGHTSWHCRTCDAVV